jgi:hypothetical protein
MPRLTFPILVLATLSTAALPSFAQQPDPSTAPSSNYMQAQPAPIQHAWDAPAGQTAAPPPPQRPMRRPRQPQAPRVTESQPAQGIFLRAAAHAEVKTVSTGADRTELSVDRGIVNVSVHHPAKASQILVDLPGGQTAILKDGFYTFNAQTSTVRVLKGEAQAFPGNKPNSKPIKVKEDHAVAFTGPNVRATDFAPEQARADVLPMGRPTEGEFGYGPGSDRPYGEGFYGSPYGWGSPYAWGPAWGPYGWGDPYWGYGYPFGFGLGFGYYGGFGYGGGFRGHIR